MATAARQQAILPDGKNMVLTQGIADSFGGLIEEFDGTPRDISSDTLTAQAWLNDASKTVTVAAASPQTGNTKGRYVVTIPVAALDGTGTFEVNVQNQITGEPAKLVARVTFTVQAEGS